MTKRTLDQIKQANKALGHHWFDASTLRFFKSRLSEKTFLGSDGTTLFVTSEKGPFEGHPRKFSIRRSNVDGSIDTVGEFQAYSTLSAALYSAEKISKQETIVNA